MLRKLHTLSYSAPAQPVFDRISRRRYRRAYREMLATQWLSRDEIRRLQIRDLTRVLNHAYEYSPFHRERLHAAGWSPGTAVDFELLKELPPMERENLQERLDDVSTLSRFRFPHFDTITSGGTTSGMPVKMFNDGHASDRKAAARMRTNYWAGNVPGEKICFFGGSTLLPRRQSLFDRTWYSLKGRKTVPHWDVSEAALARAVREINAFRPRLLMCYPSTVTYLSSYVQKQGLNLRVPAVLLSGEVVTEDSRRAAEEVLGPVYETYGCGELGDSASTCPDCRRLHIHDENVILETEPGSGALLATDLTNLATPLIRYRIGDLGQVSDEPAACGRGLTSLCTLEGRVVDVIELDNGRRLSAFALVVLLRHFPHVRAWQAWQAEAGHVHLLVQDLRPEDVAEMHQRIDANVPGLAFDVVSVDSIPATPAGKRPYFVKGRTYSGQKEIGPG